MKLSDYSKKYGLTYQTAYNHFKKGLIPNAFQLSNGTILIDETSSKPKSERKRVILYARTSSLQNKKMLDEQANRLLEYARLRDYDVIKVIKEFSSGLNDSRKQLTKILKDDDFDLIVVEHKDRLTRFGFNWFQVLTNNRIEVINNSKEKDEDVVQDLIAIIHCFSAKIYGQRRSKRIKTEIKNIIQQDASQ